MSNPNSTRPWEMGISSNNVPSNHTPSNYAPSNHTPSNHDSLSKSGTLPGIATLTNNLPPGGANGPTSPASFTPNNRTSDQWGSQTQSTRSSAYSSGFGHSANYASSFSSPHRASNSSQLGTTSYPADLNNGAGSAGPQPSPGFAPQRDSLGLPMINQQHQDHTQHRSSQDFPPQESRRSSLGSQVHQGFGGLHINGGPVSPYNAGSNPSSTLIASNLQRERGIQQVNGVRNSGTSSIHQSMSPIGPSNGESRQAFIARTAPPIMANPIKEVYNAERPTAGQPYAFPDPDMSNRSSGSAEANGSTMLSRRNSDHTSITSSIAGSAFTNDSKLPIGQHRLDEDPMPGTHHHSLQNKHLSQLSADPDSPNDASFPYSRTPALRASHKIAERKRRTEMKSLFDQLRGQIPASHGSRSSKWEILSKASDHIKNLENESLAARDAQMAARDAQMQMQRAGQEEFATLRREMEAMRNEICQLAQENQHYREHARPSTATTMNPQPHYAPPPAPIMGDPSRSLPPLANGIPAGSSMQGVQYSEEGRAPP